MRQDRFLATAILLILAASAQNPPPAAPSPGFAEFSQRVQDYVKLQKSLPRPRTTKKRQEIIQRQQDLAAKIRGARANAKAGDIFTPAGTEEFRAVIKTVFQGPGSSKVRKTVRQGEPLPQQHLTVNENYPAHVPVTTVPPTLLLHLPQLPTGVAYRIIGHDFVLEDTEARLIIDFIAGAVPST